MRELVELQSFPSSLAADVRALVPALSDQEQHPPSAAFQVQVGGERLSIPYRVYYSPGRVAECAELNGRGVIAACLGSRHHDGYLRERCLKALVGIREPWVVPFVVQLVGEYVLPIVQLIDESLPRMDRALYQAFAAANPAYCATVGRRVISYWNEYHRWQFPGLAEYPGYRACTGLLGRSDLQHQPRRLGP